MSDSLSPQDYWRVIILYGNNVATYKMALAMCLIEFAQQDKTTVSMRELAQSFFNQYLKRLDNGKPQLTNPARKTILERVVESYKLNQVTEESAIEKVAREGFSDVVPRFHNVNGGAIPLKFYEATSEGLFLTDDLLTLFSKPLLSPLIPEVGSRWDLLEAAFEMKLPIDVLCTDEETIYRSNGRERINITSTRPVLSGYQNGFCFYCGESLEGELVHVDHFIPRTFINHDEIWNLVIAHSHCNLEKLARLPHEDFKQKLYERNEYYISSNHPIKRQLISQMGLAPATRRRFLDSKYEEARKMLIHIWRPAIIRLRENPLNALGLISSS